MATTKTLTPTNQAITLAAFTEKPDNRTNVTNDDKLADAVNALNSNFYASDLGSGTLSDIQTSLETLGGSLDNYQFKNVKFAITAASGFFDDGSYIGTIKRFSSGYYCVDLQGSIPYNFIQGAYRQNIGWTWNNINSNINNIININNQGIYRVGMVVFMTIANALNAGRGTLLTVPTGAKPKTWARAVIRTDDGKNFGKIDINPVSGELTYEVATGGTYFGTVTYITADAYPT